MEDMGGPVGGIAKEPGVGVKRVEGAGAEDVLGLLAGTPNAACSLTSVGQNFDLLRPRGGHRGRHRGRGSDLSYRLLEASRAAQMGFPEAPGRLGGVGSVSASPGRVRLAGVTLRFAHSFREHLQSACSVPCAVPGTH